jgi:hypothetical protein
MRERKPPGRPTPGSRTEPTDTNVPSGRVGRPISARTSQTEYASLPGVGRGLAALMLVALAATGPLAGCGGGEQSLTASEFVSRINDEGVTIRLGKRLPSTGDADQLYAVRLPPLPGEPPPPAGSESGPGASGSLYVYGDLGGAGSSSTPAAARGGWSASRHRTSSSSSTGNPPGSRRGGSGWRSGDCPTAN